MTGRHLRRVVDTNGMCTRWLHMYQGPGHTGTLSIPLVSWSFYSLPTWSCCTFLHLYQIICNEILLSVIIHDYRRISDALQPALTPKIEDFMSRVSSIILLFILDYSKTSNIQQYKWTLLKVLWSTIIWKEERKFRCVILAWILALILMIKNLLLFSISIDFYCLLAIGRTIFQ